MEILAAIHLKEWLFNLVIRQASFYARPLSKFNRPYDFGSILRGQALVPPRATSRGFRTGNQPLQSKNMGGKAASYLLKVGVLCIGMTFLVHFYTYYNLNGF